MRVDGLGWLGVRTDRFPETVLLYRTFSDLIRSMLTRDPSVFRFADGTELHVSCGPGDATSLRMTKARGTPAGGSRRRKENLLRASPSAVVRRLFLKDAMPELDDAAVRVLPRLVRPPPI
jgi:hypothetical protein